MVKLLLAATDRQPAAASAIRSDPLANTRFDHDLEAIARRVAQILDGR